MNQYVKQNDGQDAKFMLPKMLLQRWWNIQNVNKWIDLSLDESSGARTIGKRFRIVIK